MVTFCDLFAGGGAAAAGLRAANMAHVAAVECWGSAAANYRANGGGMSSRLIFGMWRSSQRLT